MTLANLTAFERFFDRTVPAFILALGLALAGAVALIGS